jgi:hypothetical protein
MIRCRKTWATVLWGLVVLRSSLVFGAWANDQDLEFFEKRIRPILVERCYSCHSRQATKVKGGLLLDSRTDLLKGGDGGVVVVQEKPEQSRLASAIQYSNVDLQMPPKGKLPDEEIADLISWIRKGVPWPEERAAVASARTDQFDLQKRRHSHWAWTPIRRPSLPKVQSSDWCSSPVDLFILAGLERAELKPAPLAEKRALLRRVSFDLTGLPPSAKLLGDFLADPSPDAYGKVVDRLLSSPEFSERWARHWLDLVRYADTLGHEFDYPNPNAWRYRDYVIRAFNQDVPYDRFVFEHVAGDLLERPRLNPDDGSNESVIGTAFFWLGQRDHSPVDVRQHQAEVIDNQIDVLSKTFLGLTVACARCHDHKFDAIATKDYYSLYGVLSSSRYTQAAISGRQELHRETGQLAELKSRLRQEVAAAWLDQVRDPERGQAAAEALAGGENGLRPSTASIGLDAPMLELCDRAAVILPDNLPWEGWFTEGEAFAPGPAQRGDFLVGECDRPVLRLLEQPSFDSRLLSVRLQGTLRSPTFTITNRFLHILAAGREARINVPIDNFTMIRDPIYGGLKHVLKDEAFRWVTIDLGMWQGHRAYLEFSDVSAPDPGDDGHRSGFAPDGFLAVQRICFSEESNPPALKMNAGPSVMEESGDVSSATGTKDHCYPALCAAVEAWAFAPETLSPPQVSLLNQLIRARILDAAASTEAVRLAGEYAALSATLPSPQRVPAMTDGTGLDENVFLRGNAKLLGEIAPRRFLEAIAGPDQCLNASGSGRLQWARRIVAEDNPLAARVIVNRVWLHLFGRGIVATPDDFGALGSTPTHSELLDWLADWFRRDAAWSTKKLIRLLVTSSTYCMSSAPSDHLAEEKDPDNQLWHRMPVRRLEGEAIRDSILDVSDRLDETRFGVPVPIHLTEFMEGRGRPDRSGPVDGNGRRSIYIEVRRNFLSPMMRTFDTPVPFSTVGRRTVSNVPAQSLILLNDPFVVQAARRWAHDLLLNPAEPPEDRIQAAYTAAFSRPATQGESDAAIAFLRRQVEARGSRESEWAGNEDAWADLCHVLFNVKEFIFLE